MISNSVMVAITEVRTQVAKPPAPLEDRVRHAMRLTRQHWLVVDEEDRFKAAVGAVLMDATEDERERITATMRVLGGLSAAASGLPIDIGALLPDDPTDIVPLVAWWHEERVPA